MSNRDLLAIVPARGGSKGVVGKNMRSVGDLPLIAHTLETLAEARVDKLVVSSDSDEILRWSELHGYETVVRPEHLATDEATISEVAAHLADELDWWGDIGVFQPTSPFRTAASVTGALDAFRASDVDSLSSCVRERHLYWLDEDGDMTRARPLFGERVNRQYGQHRVLRETGSIQLVRAPVLRAGGQMVTERHMLFELPEEESLDIDTMDDLVAARRRFAQGTVLFRVRANARIGSGHVYHCLQLADELADQRLRFLLKDCDPFVEAMLDEQGYEWHRETDLARDLRRLADPTRTVVVNDVLDTTDEEILVQRSAGFRVVNIEDLGSGARLAHWVVNALYPPENRDGAMPHVSFGPRYATLRSEFLNLPRKEIREKPERVLITFGGTDPGGLAARCAHLLAEQVDVDLRVVLGPGAAEQTFPESVTVKRHVRSIAAEMMDADLVITAAGRTVYEAAAAGTPVAVLAAGAREASHAHLGYGSGVIFLGVGPLVDDHHILGVVERLLADRALRAELSDRLRKSIDGRGAARIGARIRTMLQGL